ncbi:MAG: glycosyltransferase [Muribaculaceae bacterium]|nr:glycosyltransferase [Muribaculaceae bacterium]
MEQAPKAPKISVIVVAFNQEATIGRTLDSIISQNFDDDVEIIIGDDASTDRTEQICRSFVSRYPDRIVYLRRPVNMGVVDNYFDCLRRARGEYLADCAADDYWPDPEKLRRQADFLDANPECSIVLTDWLSRDNESGKLFRTPDNPPIEKELRFSPGSLLPAIIAGKSHLHLCSALYRREIIAADIDRNPDIFTDPLYSCEDQQILLSLARAGVVAILPQVSLHYSVGHGSVSHPEDAARKFDYSFRALRQALRLARFFDVDDPMVHRMERRMVDHLAAMALRAGPQALPDPQKVRPRRLLRFIRRSALPVPLKARCYLAIMKFPFIWNLVNRFRK